MIPTAGSVVLQRRLRIADAIRRSGTMRVEALSEALGVSVVTVRSDLAYLEAQGMVLRGSGHARAIRSAVDASQEPASTLSMLPVLRAVRRQVTDESTVLLGPGHATVRLLPLLADLVGLNLILTTLDQVAVARACLDGPLHLLASEIGPHGWLGGPQSLHALALHAIDLFIIEAHTMRGDQLIVIAGDGDAFPVAAARHARRTLAIVTGRETQAADGRPLLPLSLVDSVLPMTPPGPDMRRALGASGFEPSGATYRRRDGFARAHEGDVAPHRGGAMR